MNASYLLRCLHFYSYFEVVVLQVLKYIVIYVVCLLQTMCVYVCVCVYAQCALGNIVVDHMCGRFRGAPLLSLRTRIIMLNCLYSVS